MKTYMITIITILFLTLPLAGLAQENNVDRITVELSDPAKPVTIELGLVNGGIDVEGYDGEEVIVEARTRFEGSTRSSESNRRGMIRIPVYSTSLEVEEYNNKVEISTESWKRAIDVSLRVPKRASLNLSCVNDGNIRVSDIIGNLEVNNVNGGVRLMNISGSVVAHALNDDLVVTFDSIDPDAPMSFSSMNGDVDVTFPTDLKCDVKIKNDMGEVYSDFQIEQIKRPDSRTENSGRSGGRYHVRIERMFYGQINGGGPEFSFSNFNGDVLIRRTR